MSNRDGIGSRIEISINGEKQYRYTLCGEGYISQNSNTEFFGLGSNTQIDYIKVTWLSGTIDYIENVNSNQQLNIVEGAYPLNVDQFSDQASIFFNNPVQDILKIESSETLQKVSIYNLMGNMLKQVKINAKSSTINLSSLSSGIYLLQFVKDEGDVYKRLVKQ